MVINSVEFLLKKTFEKLKLEEKLAIKQLGPDRLDINIIHQMKDRETYRLTELSPERDKKRKNVHVVAQRETLFFVSHISSKGIYGFYIYFIYIYI